MTLIVAHMYLNSADETLKREIIGAVVAGMPTAVAMSEPGSGSDVASLRCKADVVDGGYRINGQKTWISNAHISITSCWWPAPPIPATNTRASR